MMRLSADEMRRVELIGEQLCEPHRSAKRCAKPGPKGWGGFRAPCVRPAGHTGDCNPVAHMSKEADARFLLALVIRAIREAAP